MKSIPSSYEKWSIYSEKRYSHADGLTPGPLQVHVPLASLQIIAFSGSVADRRVFRLKRIYPPTGFSQLLPSGVILRSCTIHLTITACDFG